MQTPIERILRAASVQLGSWPTPISRISRPGPTEILVKRDDLSGVGRGGVKARKIEQVVGHMLDNRYDTLVTAVGNVTNLVHDLLPVLDRYGIRSQIVVADDPPLPTAVRLRIFAQFGVDVRLVGRSRVGVARALLVAANRSRRAGGRPFVALPSLAHPAAVVATARGFLEMVDQVDEMGAPPLQTVFITAASGTTMAGFVLAENLLLRAGHRPIHVVGVQVYPGPAKAWIHGLVHWTEKSLGMRDHLHYGRIELRTSRLHSGFGRYPRDLVQLCQTVKDETGLDIDPVFGGKTWSVMESYLAQGSCRGSVLYWHCGYTPDWKALDPWVRK
jgi:1-aminocyclopropane-1-carboxylate deaminase/D-cysteine desulfhydrase-like pyridoxal-dependent ACC family enzyme